VCVCDKEGGVEVRVTIQGPRDRHPRGGEPAAMSWGREGGGRREEGGGRREGGREEGGREGGGRRSGGCKQRACTTAGLSMILDHRMGSSAAPASISCCATWGLPKPHAIWRGVTLCLKRLTNGAGTWEQRNEQQTGSDGWKIGEKDVQEASQAAQRIHTLFWRSHQHNQRAKSEKWGVRTRATRAAAQAAPEGRTNAPKNGSTIR
jgi:hypothetical protein